MNPWTIDQSPSIGFAAFQRRISWLEQAGAEEKLCYRSERSIGRSNRRKLPRKLHVGCAMESWIDQPVNHLSMVPRRSCVRLFSRNRETWKNARVPRFQASATSFRRCTRLTTGMARFGSWRQTERLEPFL